MANGIPAIVLNLFGGVAADRIDQRRLVMISQFVIALMIFVLATITLLDLVRVWHLLTIAFLAGAVEYDRSEPRSFPDRQVEQAAAPGKDECRDQRRHDASRRRARRLAPQQAGWHLEFLFPWAASFLGLLGDGGFASSEAFDKVIRWQMVLFIFTLLVGLAYAWRKGVLEWSTETGR